MMNPLDFDALRMFVNETITGFHTKKAQSLENLSLNNLLKRNNPYLFRAKNLTVAADLIRDILDAYLSSSEEKLFGDFLEELAIYIAGQTFDGHKSAAPGIDLEFQREQVHYIVSIKSGTSWGNSSQQRQQEENFKKAVIRLKQSNRTLNVQPVLGICYGKTKTAFLRGYMKVVGQNFWYLISGDQDLYTEIIEPIGFRAEQHNDVFLAQKARIINQFTQRFMEEFCVDGDIRWESLVAFNSGNLDLD